MAFDIAKLINPRSVAVVGASTREDALGTTVLKNLLTMGFDGKIYPVNPRYEEIAGLRCYPTLMDIPEPADAVFIGIPAAGGPDVLDQAAARGIKAAEINAMGYADGGAEGAALQARIQATAAAHGMAICGPNNVGLLNVHERTGMWTMPVKKVHPGPLAVFTQSGSASMILCQDPKRIGLGYAITSGNEAVVNAADYLDYLVRDHRVELVLMFLETIRNPAKFGAAASYATSMGKRILVVKIGRSESGQAAVRAHTNSVAGDDRVYDAFFKKHGIVRLRDFDEMLEAAALFHAYPDPPPTPHVAPLTLSGGEAALVADLGSALGVSMPPLAPQTLERLRPTLPPFSSPRNPLDAWGLSWDPDRFAELIGALHDDPLIGTVVPAVDAPEDGGGDAGFAKDMARIFARLKPTTDKRFLLFNNAAAAGTDPELLRMLAESGIPCLVGMNPALAALAQWTTYRQPQPSDETPLTSDEDKWLDRLAKVDLGSDRSRFELLRDVGVPMVDCQVAMSPADAGNKAEHLGFPVVLKGAASGLAHKTDLGLVKLNLSNRQAVEAAFEDVEARLSRGGHKTHEITVQPLITDGVELLVGVRNDPAFGPTTVVGLGGVNVELLRQVSIRLGAVDAATAREMFHETLASKLLAGVRGHPPMDEEAAANAVAAISAFGASMAGHLAAVEVNPLIVLKAGSGAVGVDVLIEELAVGSKQPAVRLK